MATQQEILIHYIQDLARILQEILDQHHVSIHIDPEQHCGWSLEPDDGPVVFCSTSLPEEFPEIPVPEHIQGAYGQYLVIQIDWYIEIVFHFHHLLH